MVSKKCPITGEHIGIIFVTLKVTKFKVALNPTYRVFGNFAKSCIFSFLPKFDNIKRLKRN